MTRSFNDKIGTLDQLYKLRWRWRLYDLTFAQCDGVFDLLHPGHINCFWKAKDHADKLYVVLVADEYVRKGPDRPIFNEHLRAMQVASIECVDYVIINYAYGPQEVIDSMKPDFLVKGEEYITKPTEGFLANKALVESYGGKIIYAAELAHSSEIIARL